MKRIKIGDCLETKIDDEDFNLIGSLKWHISNGYAVHSYRENNKKRNVFLHRLLLEVPVGMFIDHVNRDKLDNRKSNLRVCSLSLNQFNRKKQSNNKSGYKGVSWNSACKKWIAHIQINGRKKHLGIFDDPYKAYLAYAKMAKEYSKEFFCP